MPDRRYLVYDVFTDTRFAGNPLAVVLDGDGLDDATMQAVACEFNLSETVFVCRPRDPAHAAALRIFTPLYELPFAGHPTVGTAITLAHERGTARSSAEAEIVVLEEKIGDIRCVVTREAERASYAVFDLPRRAAPIHHAFDRDEVAAALGLEAHEIGFDGHVVGLWSGGVPYVTVPLAGLDAMRRIAFDGAAWQATAPRRATGEVAPAYLYCRETVSRDSAFHARMLAAGPSVREDPATGSAVAALSGAIRLHDTPSDGTHGYWIEQGIEMGRPSRIRLELEIGAGEVTAARMGGHAVRVAGGTIAC